MASCDCDLRTRPRGHRHIEGADRLLEGQGRPSSTGDPARAESGGASQFLGRCCAAWCLSCCRTASVAIDRCQVWAVGIHRLIRIRGALVFSGPLARVRLLYLALATCRSRHTTTLSVEWLSDPGRVCFVRACAPVHLVDRQHHRCGEGGLREMGAMPACSSSLVFHVGPAWEHRVAIVLVQVAIAP